MVSGEYVKWFLYRVQIDENGNVPLPSLLVGSKFGRHVPTSYLGSIFHRTIAGR
jgi:hypothetical protein